MPLRDLVSGSADTTSGERVYGRFRQYSRIFYLPLQFERELWVLAIVAMSMDVTLTVHGLYLGLAERNPVARAALHHADVFGLYGLKCLVLLVGLCCRPLLPERSTAIIPLAIALPSIAAVLINAFLIGRVTV